MSLYMLDVLHPNKYVLVLNWLLAQLPFQGSTRGLNIKHPFYFGGLNTKKYTLSFNVGVTDWFKGSKNGIVNFTKF